MKFQNPTIHRSKVSNFTEKWIPYFGQNLTESSQKLISSSSPQSQPVYQICRLYLKFLLRYHAHKIFKFCFQRDITQKGG